MKIRIAASVVCFLFAAAAGAGAQPSPETGRALVDQYTDAFENLAAQGQTDPIAALDAMMNAARDARDAGSIDEEFFARYTRLLMVVTLASLPDRAGILRDLVRREISLFVADTTGGKMDFTGVGGNPIAMFSDAVAREIVALHAHAEGWRPAAQPH